jgi:polysaccharide deacetylase family protein (PEP-CTERM system associated)
LINLLTVDVEDWYHSNDFNFHPNQYENFEDRIEKSVAKVLELLEQYNIKATFFILGCIAKKHSNLVLKIVQQGHEIGSHGFNHLLVYTQKLEEFKRDVLESKHILENIIGKEIIFYRAPSWSITQKSLWALQILQEAGFKCDSSINPFVTPIYGIKGAPSEPYYPVINGKKLKLLEFPPTVFKIGGYQIPFAGGLYLRIMPIWLTMKALTSVNKTRSGMVYTHPWEMDTEQPKIRVSPLLKLTHYYNLNRTAHKLETLFNNFKFVHLGKIIQDGDYPYISI